MMAGLRRLCHLFRSSSGALFFRRTALRLSGTVLLFPIRRRWRSFFAIRDIPSTAFEVDGRLTNAPPYMHALAIGARRRAAIRKRLDLFKFMTTIMTDEFVDRHIHTSFSVQQNSAHLICLTRHLIHSSSSRILLPSIINHFATKT